MFCVGGFGWWVFQESTWTWFMCRALLLGDKLDGSGLCLAVLLEALLEVLPGLGLSGALIAFSFCIAYSLFRLGGLSHFWLPVAALPTL